MLEGVDYAGDRPDAARLFARGKRFAVRYGGPGGAWKHLTRREAATLTSAGLSIVANAEGGERGLAGGPRVGASWARKADAHFRACGMPAGRPIYLSVDFDVTAAQWPRVAAGLRGAADAIGLKRVGVYGGYDAVRWAKRDGVATWFWQTYAWSEGRWFDGNHIEQYRNNVPLADGTVDLDRAKAGDFGQWTMGGAAPAVMEEDEMSADDVQAIRADIARLGQFLTAHNNRLFDPAERQNTWIAKAVTLPKLAAELRLRDQAILAAIQGLDATAILERIEESAAAQAQTAVLRSLIAQHEDGTLDAEEVVQRISELLDAP